MRASIVLVAIALCSFMGFSQQIDFPLPDFGKDQAPFYVQLNALANVVSGDVNNSFLLETVFADSLTRDVREDLINDLSDENRAGGDYDIGISGSIRLSEKFSALVKLSDRWHLDANVPRDALSLVLLGNKQFTGDTAELSNLRYQQLRFQELSLGAQWHASPTMRFFAMASLLKGEQWEYLDLNQGWLYTSSRGDTLRALGEGEYYRSDSASVGLGAFNGWGGSMTFGAQGVVETEQGRWVYEVLIKDLGWINWNDQSLISDSDTNIRWTGVEIDDVNNLTDGALSGIDGDSLIEEYVGIPRKGTKQILLPGWVQLQVYQQRDKGWINGAGAVFRWKAQYRPYAWVQSGYQFGNGWSAVGTLGYGGYAALQAGVEVQYFSSSLMASLQLQNLEAWIVPSTLGGAGVRLSVGYLFGE